MKRYVRASISSSAPSWLKKELVGDKWNSSLKNLLLKKRIALDKVEFLDHEPAGRSLPIYLLETDYGQYVYAPGVNDDSTAFFNNRQRKFGSLAKSSLMDRSADVVWIDLDDPDSMFDKREKYMDPRRTYRYNAKQGDYAGQYLRKDYLGLDKETGESQYGPEYWSNSGKVPSNESRARDKSGYKVPSPEERIAQYYKKFPEKITNRIDRLYDKMIEVRSDLMNADFNTPSRGTNNTKDIDRAYRLFADAIYRYRGLLSDMGEITRGRSFDSDYMLREFSNTSSYILEQLDEIESLIA